MSDTALHEDLWGSDDGADDDLDDDSSLLQIPNPGGPPCKKRPAPEAPARRHIPSFQGAFSQARVSENQGYGDGLKRQRLDEMMAGMRDGTVEAYGGTGGGPRLRNGAFGDGQTGQLTLPLNASALTANLDLSSLPSLPGPLSTNYGELPDAAKLFAALGASEAPDASSIAVDMDAETLARISAQIAQSGGWSSLNQPSPQPATVLSLDSAMSEDARSPDHSRRADRSVQDSPVAPVEDIPVSVPSQPATRRDPGGLFLPSYSRPQAYGAGAAGTPGLGVQSPAGSSFPSQPGTPAAHDPAHGPATTLRGATGKRAAKGKPKPKPKIQQPPTTQMESDSIPVIPQASASSTAAAGPSANSLKLRRERGGAGAPAGKKRLPPKADLSLASGYLRFRAAEAAAASVAQGDGSSSEAPDIAETLRQAAQAKEDWEEEIRRATDPREIQALQRKAKEHVALLRRMRDALTGELVRLQIEESVLRHVRGIAKDRRERICTDDGS